MGKLKERVLQLLATITKTRSSDNALMYELWSQDMERLHQGNHYTMQTFFTDFVAGRLTVFESASRLRRKLQADNPELRDEVVYKERMIKAEEYKQLFVNGRSS